MDFCGGDAINDIREYNTSASETSVEIYNFFFNLSMIPRMSLSNLDEKTLQLGK